MKQKYLNIIIVILLVIAVGLGYLVFANETGGGQSDSQQANRRSSATGTQVNLDEIENPRQEVLNTPGPNATEAEQRRHAQIAGAIAEESNTIDIAGCSAEPLVTKTRIEETLTFKNTDSINHSVVFGRNQTFAISGNSEETYEVSEENFDKGPGLYGYGCDTSPQAAGFIIIGPQNN